MNLTENYGNIIVSEKKTWEASIDEPGHITDTAYKLRQQWLACTTGIDDLLRNNVEMAGEWIAALHDPEEGAVGKAFEDNLARTDCAQECDPEKFSRATYYSYSVREEKPGFENTMLYGTLCLKKLDSLVCARIHESRHAMQMNNTAALHASPFNPNTKIVICPQDWLLLQERCEQDAYTGQAWFSSLLAEETKGASDLNKKIVEGSELEPVSIKAFNAMRANGSLQDALIEAARQSLQKNFYSDHGDHDDYKFANSYHDQAIRGYQQVMNVRMDDRKETGFIFVRLGPKDREATVRAIGSSFGPNSFGDGQVLPEFLQPVALSSKVNDLVNSKSAQTRFDELNKKLGITDYDSLPELSDVLARQGLTMESFLSSAYATAIPATASNRVSSPSSAPN